MSEEDKGIWELEQTIDKLNEKIIELKEENSHLSIDINQREDKIAQLQELVLKSVKKPSTPWKVFMIDDKDYWIDVKRLSFVCPIEHKKAKNQEKGGYYFDVVIDSVERSFFFTSKEEATNARNFVLNIDKVPDIENLKLTEDEIKNHEKFRNKLIDEQNKG